MSGKGENYLSERTRVSLALASTLADLCAKNLELIANRDQEGATRTTQQIINLQKIHHAIKPRHVEHGLDHPPVINEREFIATDFSFRPERFLPDLKDRSS